MALVGLAGLAAPALAQSCPGGLQRGDGYPGLGAIGSFRNIPPQSNAAVVWDPDGAGPLPEELVVGGAFSGVDGVLANGIAAWDGRQWAALGSGLTASSASNGGGVTALAVHNGELYAAGYFALAPNTGQLMQVAKWDGTNWTLVGATFSGTLNALTSFNGNLYVGGRFSVSGGANIAKLVGNTWTGLGSGNIELGTRVDSLAVQGEALLVGGYFNQNLVRIAANGSRTPLGALQFSFSPSGSITSILVDGTDVYIAGDFRLQNNTQPFVMKYDGTTWTPLQAPAGSGRRRVVDFNSSIYLSTGMASSPTALLRWNGAAWVPVDPDESFVWAQSAADVAALGVFQNHLVLGGSFAGLIHTALPTDTPRQLFSLAQMSTDESIAPISRGLGARVSSLIEYQGRPIVSGRFTSIGPAGGGPQTAGQPGRLAQLDDDGFWVPFAGGLPDNNIWASTSYNGQVVVGGEPFSVGGVSNAVVAAWDGTTWHDMSAGALNFPVSLRATGSDLWAGFETTPDLYAPLAVGHWNGTSWDVFSSVSGYSELTSVGTEFYVTDNSTQKVLRWNGTGLEELPLPLTEANVRIIGVFQGDLVGVSGGTRMYRWDGAEWASAGKAPLAGLPATSHLGNSVESHGVMYVGTNYPTTQQLGEAVLSWDGHAWGSLGLMNSNPGFSNGITFSGSVRPPSLLAHGTDEVFVGGAFASVRFRGTNVNDSAADFARVVTPERLVTLAAPAEAITKNEGESVQLDWTLSSPAMNYNWYANGQPLTDADIPGVGLASGTHTASLRIDNLQPGSAGTIWCSAYDGCQILTLSTTTLTVNRVCNLDFNADGNVDQGDIDYLINIVAGGDNPESRDPDFNHDGNADQSDIDALINAIAGGSCP